MSKSRRLENGKSDLTEAKASISTVQCSQENNSDNWKVCFSFNNMEKICENIEDICCFCLPYIPSFFFW